MKTPILILSLMLTVTLGSAAALQGAEVTPDLEAALLNAGPGEQVPIIITLADKANLKSFRNPKRNIRRANIIRALKNKANLSQAQIRRFLQNNQARKLKRLWLINGMAVSVHPNLIRRLANNPRIERIQLDYAIPLADPSPAASGPAEWNIDAVGALNLWALGFSGQGVVVASMDSGVDGAHPDLAVNYRGGSNSWYDPNGEHAVPYDASGHGTQVTGIMVGGNASGTTIGVAPDAQWIAVKIFNDAGAASLSAIHQGFQWLLDPDGNPDTDDAPDIVNNSWELDGTRNECIDEFSTDIAALRQADIAVVFAAGNSGPSTASSFSPANDPGSFAVGAVTSSLDIAYFSSRGPSACGGDIFPEVVAPGVSIRTADLTFGGWFPNSYMWVQGTSFAAPHIAGGMALLISAFPDATPSELESAIASSAVDLGDMGADNDYGSGLLDVVAAYDWFAGGPTPQPGSLQFEMAAYTVAEDGLELSATVTRSGGSDGEVSVDYATLEGSASAGTDFGQTSGALVFADGEVSQSFSVAIFDDTEYEGNEDLTLSISNPTGGANLGSLDSALLTITEDDPPPGPPDDDGDGFTADADCNDNDADIYPGAPETKHDGVDQDCNGYDLTIDITRARYLTATDRIVVFATSDLGSQAGLRVTMELADGSSITRNMTWKAYKSRLQRSIRDFSVKFGSQPVAVIVLGVEGSETSAIEVR